MQLKWNNIKCSQALKYQLQHNAFTIACNCNFRSVQLLSHVHSLQPHGLQHTRPPCPSPTPGLHPNPCPSSLWCHPTISSSVIPFSSCLQSFPASRSFSMRQLFTSDGQSIGVSASTSVLPINIQDWFPLGWTCWISYSPRDSQESSPTPHFKNINYSAHSFTDFSAAPEPTILLGFLWPSCGIFPHGQYDFKPFSKI